MSTNKTENYGLHAWDPGDDFLRSEFNENFSAIDALLSGKAEIVTGSYTGDGEAERFISLGFTPRAVLVLPADSWFCTQYSNYGGLALPDSPAIVEEYLLCEIGSEGFRVFHASYTKYNAIFTKSTNANQKTYHYLAVK